MQAERGRARPPRPTVQSKSYHYRDYCSVFDIQQIIDRFLSSCRHPVRVDIFRRDVSDGCEFDSAGRQRVGLGNCRRLSFAARQRVSGRIITCVIAFFVFDNSRVVVSTRACDCHRCLCRSRCVARDRFFATGIYHAVDW